MRAHGTGWNGIWRLIETVSSGLGIVRQWVEYAWSIRGGQEQLPSYPILLLLLPFAKKSSRCVSECVRARLRARACVSEIPKTLPTLCFILLLLLPLLFFFFSFFCPCRCYVRSPRSLPAPRFFHSRTLSPEAKEARVPLRLTFSGMNYFARRVAFVKIRPLDSSNQSPAVYVAPSDATDPTPSHSSDHPVESGNSPPFLFFLFSSSFRGRSDTRRRKEEGKFFLPRFVFFCFFFFLFLNRVDQKRDDGIRGSINPPCLTFLGRCARTRATGRSLRRIHTSEACLRKLARASFFFPFN